MTDMPKHVESVTYVAGYATMNRRRYKHNIYAEYGVGSGKSITTCLEVDINFWCLTVTGR